jgi:hypothetical protein
VLNVGDLPRITGLANVNAVRAPTIIQWEYHKAGRDAELLTTIRFNPNDSPATIFLPALDFLLAVVLVAAAA